MYSRVGKEVIEKTRIRRMIVELFQTQLEKKV
jgi:hypothetical protein